jgi:16S rRNA (cytosine967-C5)-methyltransferase
MRQIKPGSFGGRAPRGAHAAPRGPRANQRVSAVPPELASRLAALEVFQGVVVHRRAVDEQFDAAVKDLAPRDRAFVRLLVATTLRRLGQIDAVLGEFLTRRPPDLERDALRFGVAQLLFLNTAPHAAVGTTVALVRARGQERLTGMVNAIMRRVAEQGAALIADQDAGRLNTVDWLWQSWARTYGADTASAIALAHLGDPPLDLSLKDAATAVDWVARLDATPLPTGTLRRYTPGRVTDLDGFSEGAWWVQDAAAALPAKILLAALRDVNAPRVVDLCAAPGGKTAQLAAAGCTVTSVDVAPERLRLLTDNLARLKLTADVVTADAVTWRPPEPADAVLLDAPCSATGTLRRHPDLPHLKQATDIAGFAENQRRLLAAALDMVKPGGLVLYSVCSLQQEEGPEVVATAGAKATRVPIDADWIGGLGELLTPDGALRVLPCHLAAQGGMDGFFGVMLKKNL